ncbi:MAG TPA: lysophospholipid acyltransferase family protein [Stellaceae bacterium]|jgi:1-acyl-sn-glycerol-3-phosphate acyltransferase|nr:lysophospholipid acyltransferase family protein [Stellaceae bacterium]
MGSPTLRLARLALYFAWTAGLMPVQLAGLGLRRHWTSTLPVFYHRWCCRILGFRIRVIGTPTSERPVLYAANHISYTDVTVLGSVIPGSFIAKSEVARWPFFGWLAKLQRSVFVDRRARSTVAQRDAIGKRLADGDALILFPEGTSGDGNRVRPFKSALFAAAQQREGIPPVIVQPVSLAYTRLDGIPIRRLYRPFFAWYGAVDLAPHLWSMVGLGTVDIVVEFHPPTFLRDCGSRKALAEYCHGRIAGGVAAALFDRPQPMPEPPVPGARFAFRGKLPSAIPQAVTG